MSAPINVRKEAVIDVAELERMMLPIKQLAEKRVAWGRLIFNSVIDGYIIDHNLDFGEWPKVKKSA